MSTKTMLTTGTFQDVVDAQIRAYFDRHKEEQSSELYYQELGLVDYEPDVPEEKMNDISGPGRGILTIENQRYGANTKTRGYSVTLTLRKYTSDLEYTEEDIHWIEKQSSSKRKSTLKNAASGAVQALYQNINEDTAKVFYLGHGTTFLTVGNSEALFGSHTIKGTGSTQYNNFGSGDTERVLSATNLVDAIAKMNRFQAHNGIQLVRVRHLKLMVAAENIALANQIVYSMYGPDTANLGESKSSKSALGARNIKIEVVEVPDFPYAYRNYWFLCDVYRAKQRAFMAWAWKPRMKRDEKESKGAVSELCSALFGPFIIGWQWAFSSKGDATSI